MRKDQASVSAGSQPQVRQPATICLAEIIAQSQYYTSSRFYSEWRAIYPVHPSLISALAENGSRLRFPFSLGKFYLDGDQTVDMPTDRRDHFRVADVRWADGVRPQRLDRRAFVNDLLTIAA
jgi:hypothetical protein